MSDEICICGHLRTEHSDVIEHIDRKMNRPYKQWVACMHKAVNIDFLQNTLRVMLGECKIG